MTERCYVYAIIPSLAQFPSGPTGSERGGTLHAVAWRDLAAVVRLDGSGEVALPTPENLLRHEAIVETVRRGGPALPVRFGTVLADPDAVREALAQRYDTLLDDLRRVGDKFELGVTALWRHGAADSNAFQAAPRPDEPKAQREGTATAELQSGASYLRARMAEHRRAMQSRERAEDVSAELDIALRRHALDARRILCPSERLALRTTYLVSPDRLSAFVDAFDVVRQEQRAVHLLLSGPWPPYSFVTMPDPEARLPSLGAI